MARTLIPTCAYHVDVALVELLDERLGPPLDSYVRGWQVWLEENGPLDAGARLTLEWRLHPPSRFTMPTGVNPHDLFDLVLQGIADAGAAGSEVLRTGREDRPLHEIWEVLEVFPAYGGEPSPQSLATAVTEALGGRAPDAAGHVDHDRLGDLWKGRRGDFSVAGALFEQLDAWPPDAQAPSRGEP